MGNLEENIESVIKQSFTTLNETLSKNEKENLKKFLRITQINIQEYLISNYPKLSVHNDKLKLDPHKTANQIENIEIPYSFKQKDKDFIDKYSIHFPYLIAITLGIAMGFNESKIAELEYLNFCRGVAEEQIQLAPFGVDLSPLDEGVIKLKKRIKEVEAQIESETFVLEKIANKEKKEERKLIWNGQKLSKVSQELKKFGCTKNPTDFEKVFTEKQSANWLLDEHTFSFLIFSLHQLKGKEGKPIFAANRSYGYQENALLYFNFRDTKKLSRKKNKVASLAEAVRLYPKAHKQSLEIVNKIITIIQET